jgi:hypothetical protein
MMRKGLGFLALGFTVTLAAIVGTRMSSEALAVVIGVICGVAAGIPVSLLILAASNRQQQQSEEPSYSGPNNARYGAFPPVVVIQGGAPASAPQLPPYYQSGQAMYEAMPRQFHLVGEQDE